MNPGPYAGDYFNSLMIVSSTLAALHKANRTGKGESIDLAMYETLLAIGQYYLVDYLNEGILWPRPGARNQNLCGIGEYKCNDGFLGVCLYGVDQNKYFLETIGLGHLWGTEDIPEDTSGLWLANPHAAEIEGRPADARRNAPGARGRRAQLRATSGGKAEKAGEADPREQVRGSDTDFSGGRRHLTLGRLDIRTTA